MSSISPTLENKFTLEFWIPNSCVTLVIANFLLMTFPVLLKITITSFVK